MLLVGQYPDLSPALDEGAVELVPRASRQRDDVHIVVGEAQGMRQHLQRAEAGYGARDTPRELAHQRCGEAEEERVARGEDHDGRVVLAVLSVDVLQRHGDVDPEGILGEQGRYELVVPASP